MIHYYVNDTRAVSIGEFGHTCLDRVKTIPVRTRDDYLLHIVLSGELRFMEKTSLPSGHALLISRGHRHAFSVHPPYEHYWFAFCGDGVPALFSQLGIDVEAHATFVCRDFERVRALLANAFEAPYDHGDDSTALSAALAVLPLLSASDRIEAPKSIDYVAMAELFVRRNIYRAITATEIADNVHISEKHLCRLFIKARGISLKQHVLRVKMEYATMLLTTTDLYIKEVAASVGYASQLAFSAAYRKICGVSPTEARNLARKSGKRT